MSYAKETSTAPDIQICNEKSVCDGLSNNQESTAMDQTGPHEQSRYQCFASFEYPATKV